jgi:hypothetical protein
MRLLILDKKKPSTPEFLYADVVLQIDWDNKELTLLKHRYEFSDTNQQKICKLDEVFEIMNFGFVPIFNKYI